MINQYKKLTKKQICELAYKILGTRKISDTDDVSYMFKVGNITLRIMNYSVFGSRSFYKYFNLNGSHYIGQVFDCTVWIGQYQSICLYYTLDTMEEINYEWKQNKD